jgi:hypothetical protein
MKFLQIAVTLALLVASTYALKCNNGLSVGSSISCASQDVGTVYDTCFSGKFLAAGVTSIKASACQSTGDTAAACSTIKATSSDQASFKTCQTDNCNSCSPSSALQVSFAFLFAAVAAMML